MEVDTSSFTNERLCGGENNNIKQDFASSKMLQNGNTDRDVSNEIVNAYSPKPKSSSFFHRTLKSVLKIRRNPSTNSYDMDSGISMPSSKEDCLSENEDKCDGVDSGIASEAGDCPPSSRLSSCTNFTGSSFGDRVPGICGLPNLGNTCYMNSVLQCLGHLDIVVEYFAMDKYRADMKQKRTLFKSRKLENHVKGKLTEHLAEVLKCLWNFESPVNNCKGFKETVLKCGEQYRGALQQDAQEFLLWLLNHLHEDLCKNASWGYSKSSLIRRKKLCTDEEEAARTLAVHAQQNRSFIRNIFQAQYKSSIVCSNCNTCSSTFDPYLCISLSIPQKDVKPMYVTMLFSSTNKCPLKFGVSVPYSGTIRDLRRILSKAVKVSEERLIIALVYEDGDHCSLHDESMIEAIPELDDCLFAIEAPSLNAVKSLSEAPVRNRSLQDKASEVVKPPERNCAVDGLAASFNQRMQLSLAREENNTIVVVVTNVEVKGKRSRRFGFPITLRVSKDVTFKELQILIRRDMQVEIRNSINQEARNWKLVLGIRVVGGIIHNEYLKESDAHPLRQPTVERGVNTNITAGPFHVSLVAEWEPESQDWCLAVFGLGFAEEDISVEQTEEEFGTMQSFSLKDCLELHTKEEELHYEDCWKCPNCKTDVNRTTKVLSLWTLPDVLVLHLKRFQQANQWKGKISADVQFPLHGLDMSSHLAKRSKVSNVDKKNLISKAQTYNTSLEIDECVYDLFCVCNHIGPYITSGHYTANCKNSANGSWYCYDDTAVYEIGEEQVCTRSAYMLFYQKRSAVSRSASSHSLSSLCSHWSQFLSNAAMLDGETER